MDEEMQQRLTQLDIPITSTSGPCFYLSQLHRRCKMQQPISILSTNHQTMITLALGQWVSGSVIHGVAQQQLLLGGLRKRPPNFLRRRKTHASDATRGGPGIVGPSRTRCKSWRGATTDRRRPMRRRPLRAPRSLGVGFKDVQRKFKKKRWKGIPIRMYSLWICSIIVDSSLKGSSQQRVYMMCRTKIYTDSSK